MLLLKPFEEVTKDGGFARPRFTGKNHQALSRFDSEDQMQQCLIMPRRRVEALRIWRQRKGILPQPEMPENLLVHVHHPAIIHSAGRRRRVILGQGLVWRNERRFASVIREVSTPAAARH